VPALASLFRLSERTEFSGFPRRENLRNLAARNKGMTDAADHEPQRLYHLRRHRLWNACPRFARSIAAR